MNADQLKRAKEIEKALEAIANHRNSIIERVKSFEKAGRPLELSFAYQSHNTYLELFQECLIISPEVLIEQYLHRLTKEEEKLQKEFNEL